MAKSLKEQFAGTTAFEKVIGGVILVPLTVYRWYRKITDPPRREFTSNLGTLKLPETWTDKPHRLAFDAVGRYVTDALTRHEMLCFEDRHLKDPNSLSYIDNVSLTVWDDVLKLFANAGWILCRWRLVLERPLSHTQEMIRFTPQHDEHGAPLPRPEKNMLYGLVLEEGKRNNHFLTDEDCHELIRMSYPLYPNDGVRTAEHPDRPEQQHVVVDMHHFERIYYRPFEILDAKSEERANQTLKTLGKAKAFKGQ